MKEIILGILSISYLVLGCAAVAAVPCCDDTKMVVPGGFCDENNLTRIKLSCPYGMLPLRDVTVKGEKLYTQDAPTYPFATNSSEYCLGEMLRDKRDPGLGRIPVAIVCFQKELFSESQSDSTYLRTGALTLISVVFLMLTFGIYMFLPNLRDLQGKCYMCLCISMALGFLSLGILQLNPTFEQEICTAAGFLIYFWMMATFFWMNVISINLYRTVLDPNHLKKTERKQFFYYSCYAWGGTVVWFIIVLITNFVEGQHLKPGFGTTSCWFQDRTSTWVYFYGPVAVLIILNVSLFLLTFRDLWRHTMKYDASLLNNLKYKFLLSLRLVFVMGISWTFEIASFAHGESHIIWTIMDIFNCLQGVVIFLILVVLRTRVVRGLADANCCVFVTRKLGDKLSPHDDSDDQQMLDDDPTEVRLN